MISTAYRNDLDALLAAREELLAQRRSELDHTAPLRAIQARRQAAIAGGAVMAAGGLTVFLGVVVRWLLRASAPSSTLTDLLLGTWVAAAIAYAATWLFATTRSSPTQRIDALRTEDPRADLLALRASHPLEDALARAARGLRLRLGVPLVGFAMILPLTLHYLVAEAADLGSVSTLDFDGWICATAICVGHSHLVLAALSWRYAGKLATEELAPVSWLRESLRALAITALSAVVPTVIFGALFVLVTGLVPVLLLFSLAHRAAARERLVISRYERELSAS